MNLEKIIDFENGATGLLKIFTENKEFTITFLLGKYYCTPKAHKYEINESNDIEDGKEIRIIVDIPVTSVLAYSAVDSLGYTYGNIDLFREKLENEIKNLYIENKL